MNWSIALEDTIFVRCVFEFSPICYLALGFVHWGERVYVWRVYAIFIARYFTDFVKSLLITKQTLPSLVEEVNVLTGADLL